MSNQKNLGDLLKAKLATATFDDAPRETTAPKGVEISRGRKVNVLYTRVKMVVTVSTPSGIKDMTVWSEVFKNLEGQPTPKPQEIAEACNGQMLKLEYTTVYMVA